MVKSVATVWVSSQSNFIIIQLTHCANEIVLSKYLYMIRSLKHLWQLSKFSETQPTGSIAKKLPYRKAIVINTQGVLTVKQASSFLKITQDELMIYASCGKLLPAMIRGELKFFKKDLSNLLHSLSPTPTHADKYTIK